MARHLPVVRIRLSSALIALVFVITLVTYLLVRPTPASIAKDQSPAQPHSTGRSTPSPSLSSRSPHTPAPSPTRPTATPTASPAAASAGPHSGGPSPAPGPGSAEPTTR
jgi:predicted lipid-binding transport protein (Tim44 family)